MFFTLNIHSRQSEKKKLWIKQHPDTGWRRNFLIRTEKVADSKTERLSYDLEMKTREQYRNNKRMEIERFDWFIEQIQTRVAFGWLSERSGKKNFMPKNFLEINRYFALTSYCNTIGQSNNAFSILGFSLAGKRRGHVWSLIFRPLADKSNNEYLPKPFFKVIRKSLYQDTCGRGLSLTLPKQPPPLAWQYFHFNGRLTGSGHRELCTDPFFLFVWFQVLFLPTAIPFEFAGIMAIHTFPKSFVGYYSPFFKLNINLIFFY